MIEQNRHKEVVLLTGTFLIAISGLVYELLEGTISSYLLGDSVYHFSLVIGLFMSSMGIGAWLSRFVDTHLERAFVLLQMGISMVGGYSALVLFYAFAFLNNYEGFLYLITITLGILLGAEIPLIIRILKESFSLKTNISNVFTLDYIGALFAALLFPLVLVPQLGLMQTSFLFGLLNLFVGFMAWSIFRKELGIKLLIVMLMIATALLYGLFTSNTIVSMIEDKLYKNKIIYSKQTLYQKLIVTAQKGRVQFYINGAIQFDSLDEYRYHESLVHPAMHTALSHENVLIIGGGDGMALREVLKYNDLGRVTLVDLDVAVTTLFKTNPKLTKLNNNSLNSDKLTLIHQDAWKFLEESKEFFDVIIIDLPDPNNYSLSRLYSVTFYRLVGAHLSKMGAMVTQATSPLFAQKAFWSIVKTIQEAALIATPYHVYIPSFGEWGFVLATHQKMPPIQIDTNLNLRFLNDAIFQQMQIFPPDMKQIEVESNRLSNHKLIYYYDKGWEQWYEN